MNSQISQTSHAHTAHDLRTMLSDLAALQTLSSAGSLRSAHRDPRESAGRTTGARKEPETLPVEGASDSGALGRACRSSRILARVPYPHHRVLLWIADRAHGSSALPWAWVLAQALAPVPLRDAVERAEARASKAAAIRNQLRAALSKGSRRVTAESLRGADQVRRAHSDADAEAASTQGAAEAARAKLQAWGERELENAMRVWFAARVKELGQDAGTETEVCA